MSIKLKKSRLYRFVPVIERPEWKAFAFNQSGTAQILASLSFLFWDDRGAFLFSRHRLEVGDAPKSLGNSGVKSTSAIVFRRIKVDQNEKGELLCLKE
ncbi:hypothetical protein B1B04_15810 [Lysinibacillus sp. KCTC 33748]|nr:hypothetical protein B1B04_15810 [Lysinibacillus sp. KCTC 33748]